jgi:hypothetical protein
MTIYMYPNGREKELDEFPEGYREVRSVDTPSGRKVRLERLPFFTRMGNKFLKWGDRMLGKYPGDEGNA